MFVNNWQITTNSDGVVAANSPKSDEKVPEVAKSADTTLDSPFTGMYCRGIQSQQQIDDIKTSTNMFDYFIFDSLTVISTDSPDVSIGTLDASNCAGIQAINGQVQVTIKTMFDWVPLLRSKGVKYIGFDFEDDAWEVIATWYSNPSQYATAISNLLKNIKALADDPIIKLNLIDSDAEAGTIDNPNYPNIGQVHIDFFSDIYQQCGISTLTAAPYAYYAIQTWINIATGLCARNGKAMMKWCNYQAYGGGNDIAPWTTAIMNNHKAMGLTADEATKFLCFGAAWY